MDRVNSFFSTLAVPAVTEIPRRVENRQVFICRGMYKYHRLVAGCTINIQWSRVGDHERGKGQESSARARMLLLSSLEFLH